ncbi:hypothetical protein C1645_827986 [Glomus cerebriforme]|uniref:Uncharacterized protein n=1 Tax=Glomus cerebriforme TaxID=658196 RepID=A0A397STJ3_9GLOM|nr:hypothetical protein C1645_827986 [Glomus cerebriforme]
MNTNNLVNLINSGILKQVIQGAEEIIGGYNFLIWKGLQYGEIGIIKDNFTVVLKNTDNFNDPIFSHLNFEGYGYCISLS